MFRYDFVEVPIKTTFKTGCTASFDRSVEIIKERAAEGWKQQQLMLFLMKKQELFQFKNRSSFLKRKSMKNRCRQQLRREQTGWN